MNQITTQLDRIIARLKQNEKLAKVKFIREHGNHGAEINLTSFLAVVILHIFFGVKLFKALNL